ncbi:MAG TPA: protease modulator HflK [Chthoniobacterales bacterium]|jgi:HflK protein|nr:protease modulator HflK [Chthoniobacterales bacterium]
MKQKREDALFSAHTILAALRSSIRVLRWGMLVLVLVYLCSGITVVKPNERALVLRFGRALPQSAPPGLLFAFPAPIDEVIMIPAKSVQEVSLDAWASTDADASLNALNPATDLYTVTGDINIVRARFVARFHVADPVAYEFTAANRNAVRDAIFYQSICRTLAGMTVDDALTTRREFIGQQVMRLAQAEFDRLHLGVELLALETREINPPATVLPAFQDVVSAKVEAKTLVEPANTRRASEISAGNAEAYRIQQEADSYAQGLIAKAQGEASSFRAFLTEYRANPATVHARLYADMIENVLPKLRITTVLPNDRANIRILVAPEKADGVPDETGANDQAPPPPLPGSSPAYPKSIEPMETDD